MTLQIPASVEEIDEAWLSAATESNVTAAEFELIGVGLGVSSSVYRAKLIGDGPASVIVKMPALDEAAVFTATMLRMYIREVRFFDELAADSPIRVPKGYFGAVDEETSQFVQVMEDMGDLRVCDQIKGMSLADAESAVDSLAAWHAQWWGKAGPIVARGTAVALGDPIYLAVLPVVFAEGWEKISTEMSIDSLLAKVGPAWCDALPRLLTSLDASPSTVTHGDYRADNILFDDSDTPVLLDFQLTGSGSGAYDLAYLITQSLAPDLAAANEAALFDRWLSALIAHGVPEVDTEGLWDRYREAALFCLTYPVVAARGMDLSDQRQYDLIDSMTTRFARVLDQLNLADLL